MRLRAHEEALVNILAARIVANILTYKQARDVVESFVAATYDPFHDHPLRYVDVAAELQRKVFNLKNKG